MDKKEETATDSVKGVVRTESTSRHDQTDAAVQDKSMAVTNTTKSNAKIKDMEQRLLRVERRIKSNERFAKTFANALSTQVIAIDAVTDVMARALRENVNVHDELSAAIREYDKHKIRRWFSGLFGVLLWITSVVLAAVVGAFIYWLFSGK